MSENRCTKCGELGHKRTAHELYQPLIPKLAVRRRHAASWYVLVHDVSGVVTCWSGPLFYNVALGAARAFEALDDHARSSITSGRTVAMRGEPEPLPACWRDYEPTTMDRVPRLRASNRRAA